MRRFTAISLVLLAVACGANSAAPASSPAPTGGVERQSESTEGLDQKAPPNKQFSTPPPSSTMGDEDDGDGLVDLDAALSLFQKSELELSGGLSDCDHACKALGSMERSMNRICELTGPEDVEHRCEDARKKARRARERVEKNCPRC